MNNPPAQPILLSPRSILMIIGLLLLLWVVFLLRELVLLLLLACLVSAALYPTINWLTKKRIPRKLAILLCYLLLALLLTGIGFLLFDIIVAQGQALITALPSVIDRTIGFIHSLPFAGGQSGELLSTLSHSTRSILMQALNFAQEAFNYLVVLFQGFFGIITILVFSFFLLSNIHYFKATLLRLIPSANRDQMDGVLNTIAHKAGAYARGQLSVMTVTGFLTGLGLYFLGVPYALTLGVITFLLDIIPILGPFFAAGFGIIVALAQDPMLALWTALLYLTVQQIENNLLSPMILGKSVGLNSFWIFFSIFAGGTLFGIVGVILAVPTAVTIGLLIEEFYIKGVIEKNHPAPTPTTPT